MLPNTLAYQGSKLDKQRYQCNEQETSEKLQCRFHKNNANKYANDVL